MYEGNIHLVWILNDIRRAARIFIITRMMAALVGNGQSAVNDFQDQNRNIAPKNR